MGVTRRCLALFMALAMLLGELGTGYFSNSFAFANGNEVGTYDTIRTQELVDNVLIYDSFNSNYGDWTTSGSVSRNKNNKVEGTKSALLNTSGSIVSTINTQNKNNIHMYYYAKAVNYAGADVFSVSYLEDGAWIELSRINAAANSQGFLLYDISFEGIALGSEVTIKLDLVGNNKTKIYIDDLTIGYNDNVVIPMTPSINAIEQIDNYSIEVGFSSDEQVDGYQLEIDGVLQTETDLSSVVIGDLDIGVDYSLRVRSIISDVYSDWAEITTFKLAMLYLETPNITNMVQLSDSTIQVEWDTINGAINYELEINGQISIFNATSCEVGYLDGDTEYLVRVRAIATELTSDWSSYDSITLVDSGGNTNGDVVGTYDTIRTQELVDNVLIYDSFNSNFGDWTTSGSVSRNKNNKVEGTKSALLNTSGSLVSTINTQNKNNIHMYFYAKAVNYVGADVLSVSYLEDGAWIELSRINAAANSLGFLLYDISFEGIILGSDVKIKLELIGNNRTKIYIDDLTIGYNDNVVIPMTPSITDIIQLNNSSINIEYTTIETVDGYQVEVDQAIYPVTNSLSYTVDSLLTNTVYPIRVRVIKDNIYSDWSDTTSFELSLHSIEAPTNLQHSDLTDSSVRISWDHTSNISNLDYYSVYLNNSLYTTTTNNFIDIAGLLENTDYNSYVVANGLDGTTSINSEIHTFKTNTVSPQVPLNLALINATSTTIEFDWDHVTNQSDLLHYNVFVNGELYGSVTDDNIYIFNLIPNTSYNLQVNTENNSGDISEMSDSIVVDTLEDIIQPPSNVIVSTITSNSAVISWDHTANFSKLFEYQIFLDNELFTITRSNNYQLDGLLPESDYEVYIVAVSNLGAISDPTVVESFTTLSEPIEVPQNVTSYNITENSMNLGWNDIADIENLKLYYVYVDGEVYTTEVNTILIEGLEPGNTYSISLMTEMLDGSTSEMTPTILVNTLEDTIKPSIPTNLVVVDNIVYVVLSWDASTDLGGISGYEIYRNGELIDTVSSVTYTDIAYTEGSLDYSVIAVDNYANKSEPSDVVNIYVDYTDPDPVVIFGSYDVDTTSILILWEDGTDNLGVKEYDVYRDDILQGTTSELSYTDDSIEVDNDYNYYVISRDMAGNNSQLSNIVELSTKINLESPTIKIDNISTTYMDISWNAISGATGYNIMINEVSIDDITDLSYRIVGLVPGQNYDISICSKRDIVYGDWSSTINITTSEYNTIPSTISADMTLTKEDAPYKMTGVVSILEGVTLTLEPGVVIVAGNFSYQAYNYRTYFDVYGNIVAIGTEEDPVVFTNIYNHLGQTTPDSEKYFWGGIIAHECAGLTLDYVDLSYAGGSYSEAQYTQYSQIIANCDIQLTNSYMHNPSKYHNITVGSNSKNINISDNILELNRYYRDESATGINFLRTYGNNIIVENNIIRNASRGMAIDLGNCSSSDDLSGIKNNTFENCTREGIYLDGQLSGSLTLPKNMYFIESNIIVPENTTLTLEPGVKILAGTITSPAQNYKAYFDVYGSLVAIGTQEEPIVFSSSYARETLSQQEYFWGGILAQASGSLTLEYIDLSYAGGAGYNSDEHYTSDAQILVYGDIYLSNSNLHHTTDSYNIIVCSDSKSIQITNNIIASNSIYNSINSSGIRLWSALGNSVSIENNIIKNASKGMELNLSYVGEADLSGIKNNTFENCIMGGIYLDSQLSGNLILPKNVYFIDGSRIVPENKTLTIEPGVEIVAGNFSNQAINYQTYFDVYGNIVAVGTEEDPIVFTNTYNYDGQVTPSDTRHFWGGMLAQASSGLTLEYIDLSYAGGAGYTGDEHYTSDAQILVNGDIYLRNSNLHHTSNYYNITINSEAKDIIITNNVIASNTAYNAEATTGIRFWNTIGNIIQVENNIIRNASRGMVLNLSYSGAADLGDIRNNTFENCTVDGVYLDGQLIEDLTLPKNVYFFDRNIIVPENITLTLEPGTIIVAGDMVNSTNNYKSYFDVQGNFVSVGTNEEPIIFTNTYNYLEQTTPLDSTCYWGGIISNATSSIIADNIDLSYAGGYSRYDAYTILTPLCISGDLILTNSNLSLSADSKQMILSGQNSSVIIRNNIFNNNSQLNSSESTGIMIQDMNNMQLTIQDNILTNMTMPFIIYFSSYGGADFTGINNNQYQNCSTNRFKLYGSVVQNTILPENRYYFTNCISISEGATLGFEPGSTVLGYNCYSYIDVFGELDVIGTAEKPITMTSINNNGSVLSDYSYYWGGINVKETGVLRADYLDISYGGGAGGDYDNTHLTDWAIINCKGDLSLSNSRIYNPAKSYAIRVDVNNKSIQLVNNEISTHYGSAVGYVSETYGVILSNAIDSNIEIENNNFDSCIKPISIQTANITNTDLSLIANNTFVNNRYNGIKLEGTVNNDLSLPENIYYITTFWVGIDGILTIAPGSKIYGVGTNTNYGNVDIGSSYKSSLSVSGTLIANGTEEKPIIMTSISNFDNTSVLSDYAEYWGGINIEETGTMVAEYLDISYGGGAGDNYDNVHLTDWAIINCKGNLYLNNSEIYYPARGYCVRLEVENKTIDITNTTMNTHVTGSDWGYVLSTTNICATSLTNSDINIRNNHLNNSIIPFSLSLSDLEGTDLSNISENSYNNNRYNGICVSSSVQSDLLLPEGIYYFYTDFRINEGATLTLSPGVTLIASAYSQTYASTQLKDPYETELIIQGKLMALGTPEQPVKITSCNAINATGDLVDYHDYWGGIQITETGTLIGNYMDVSYGGCESNTNYSNIDVKNNLILMNSKIHHTSYGQYGNSGKGITFDGADEVYLSYNSIYSNNDYALYSNDEALVVAERLYYGTSSGPSTRVWDGENWIWVGTGPRVYGNIDVSPYLSSETFTGEYFLPAERQYFSPRRAGVYAPTGNFSHFETDLTAGFLNNQITFGRTYNSQLEEDYGFGKGWTFSFFGEINSDPNEEDTKIVTLNDGSQYVFDQNGDGTYSGYNTRSTMVMQNSEYILTTKEQIKYYFNAYGYLYKIVDQYGNALTIDISPLGVISRITDYAGRVYTINYVDGHAVSLSDNAGRTITYTYENDLLDSVSDAMGITSSYSYDMNGLLTEIRNDENTIVKAITYAAGTDIFRVETIIDELGNVSTYSYNDYLGSTEITDSNGRTTTQAYDSTYSVTTNTDPEGLSTNVTYNVVDGMNYFNEITSVTDRNGNITSYDYDIQGNVTKTTYSDGSYVTYTYDSKNHVISEQDELGHYTFYIYDVTQTYLVKVVKPLDGVTTYSDGANQSLFSITSMSYYSLGENGVTIKGLLKSSTDANGNTTYFTYDSHGNMLSTTDADGNQVDYTYTIRDQVATQVTESGYITAFTYNLNGKTTEVLYNNEDAKKMFYDALGRLYEDRSPNESENNLSGTLYSYYPNGTLQSITDPMGNVTVYTYDVYGNIATKTLPNSDKYYYTYDVMNRLISKSYQANSTSDIILLENRTYDILENGYTSETITTYTDAANTLTMITTKDAKGKVVKVTNPDGTYVSMTYNANGLVSTKTDQSGNTTYYYYNALNQLISQYEPVNTNQYRVAFYTYDLAGNVLTEKAGIDLVALNGIASTYIDTTYTYTTTNLVSTIINSEGRKVERFYSPEGEMIRELIWIDGTTYNETVYTYDDQGNILTIKEYVEAKSIYGNALDATGTQMLETTLAYDGNNNLLSSTLPDGTFVTYTYDANNNQTSQSMTTTDENSSTVTSNVSKTYDYMGNVVSSTDAEGNQTTNTYDVNGNLLTTTDANGGVSAYYYDYAGRLIAEVAPEHYDINKQLSEMTRVEYTYDNSGRLYQTKDIYYDMASQTFKTIVAVTYTYDSNGNVLTEMDALGAVKSYTYYYDGSLKTELTPEAAAMGYAYNAHYSYDGGNRLIQSIDGQGVITEFEYDKMGNQLRIQMRETSSSQPVTISSATYDLVGNMLSSTDGNGTTTYYTYNSKGQLLREVDAGDSSIVALTINYQYDLMGNVKSITNSYGQKILYTYDNRGNVLSTTESDLNGDQAITTSATYDLKNQQVTATDGNGNTTTYAYDGVGNVLSSAILVSGTTHIDTMTYDRNGNLLTSTDWLGNTYTYIYDDLNRLYESYDPLNNRIEKYTYNDLHQQITSIDTLGHITTFAYDHDGRLTETIYPMGNSTEQSYDLYGNIISTVDGEGNETSYEFNYLGQMISVVNALDETTAYTYDLNGNMLTQTDANGHTTTYTYNVANMLLAKYSHGGLGDTNKTETYSYDAIGNLTSKVDKNGITTTFTYDIHGRLLSQAAGSDSVAYTYDNNSNLLTALDTTGLTTRTYDALGRVTSKTVPIIGTVTYTYDNIYVAGQGKVSETTLDPVGNLSIKVYDEARRLIKIISGVDETIYTYYNNGSKESVVYPDGSMELYTYDDNNQLTGLTNKDSYNVVLDIYSYTYDDAGNQLTKDEVINSLAFGITTYTYDNLNRLSTVLEPSGKMTSYAYDSAGNRVSESTLADSVTTVRAYLYDEQNRLTDIVTTVGAQIIEETSYTYDPNGNQLSTEIIPYEATDIEGVITYTPLASYIDQTNTYNAFNELVMTVTQDGTIVENTYNAEGYRSIKSVDGDVTRYLYEYDKVVLETDNLGNETAYNLYGIYLIMRRVSGDVNESYYYMYNGHGDVTALIDVESKAIVGTYYYDSFGVILSSTGDVDNSINYAGYQYDDETGLYYLNARMYDPKIARFLQEDSYYGQQEDPLSLNLYTYCANNPVVYWDPSGHQRCDGDYGRITSNTVVYGGYGGPSKNDLAEDVWTVIKIIAGDKSEETQQDFNSIYNDNEDTWDGVYNTLNTIEENSDIIKDIPAINIGWSIGELAHDLIYQDDYYLSQYDGGFDGWAKEAAGNLASTALFALTGSGSAIGTAVGKSGIIGTALFGTIEGASQLISGKGFDPAALAQKMEYGFLFSGSMAIGMGPLGGLNVGTMTLLELEQACVYNGGAFAISKSFTDMTSSGLDYSPQTLMDDFFNGYIFNGITLGAASSIAAIQNGGAAYIKNGINELFSKGANQTDEIIGGAYKDVPANGGQRHHMPADSVSPYSKTQGPVIQMETADHMQTASWGSSKQAKLYREMQAELIEQGKFLEAQMMDIVDVQTKFGTKYDTGIQQMLEFMEELLK